jgi:hypothetical protein
MSHHRASRARRNPLGARLKRIAAAGVLVGLAAACLPLAAQAVPGVGGAGTYSYTEQDPTLAVGSGITISSSGSSYGGGYVDFDLGNGASSETLSLRTDATPDATNGAVSIVGDAVYLGDGTTAQPVGSVDPVRNGENGQPLRVNFTTPFENPGFESPQTDNGVPIGWHAIDGWINLGTTEIPPGHVSVDNSTYPAFSEGNPNRHDDIAPASMTYNVDVQSAEKSEGSSALQLVSAGTSTGDCDVIHGPAVYSDPFQASAGDHIYFDWAAKNGGDWYDVFGYLYNQDTGTQTTVIDSYGDTQNWTTKDTTIPADGHYQFVFVSGTYDMSCGRATGASLYIDNVKVYGSKVKDAVVQDVAQRLQYHNASDNPPTQRQIKVTAVDSEGESSSSSAGNTVTVNITPVDDPPTVATPTAVSYTNTAAADTFAPTSGKINATDPDDTIVYGLQGDHAEAATVGGVSYDRAVTGHLGTLRLSSTTGDYLFVPNASLDTLQLSDSESYTVTVSSDAHPDVSATAVLNVSADVQNGPPGAPTALTATAEKNGAGLSWTAPAWIGNSPITGYAIESSTDGGTSWDTVVADTGSTATSYEADGLTGGSSVSYRVRAINANGTGDATSAASVTPYDVSTAPQNVSAAPGDTTAIVTWEAPAADNGSAVTGYLVQTSTGGDWSDAGVAEATARSLPVSGLSNGTAYSFRVIAVNAGGSSPASDPASATPRTTPGPVRNVTATPQDGAIKLDWSVPADDGGAPVTSYSVEQSDDRGDTWTAVGTPTGTTLTVPGLTNGTSVRFRIAASNAAGYGPTTDSADVSPRTEPGAPTVTGVKVANGTLTIAFDAPSSDGGAKITGYEYTLDGGATWIPASSTTSPLIVRGLANGTKYTVGLRAVNAAGGGTGTEANGTPVVAPVMDPDGSTPRLSGSGSQLVVNGEKADVNVSNDGKTVQSSGPGFSVELAGLDPAGQRRHLDALGRIVLAKNGTLLATGTGYKPGSSVDVWLLSGPTLLGTAQVGADGSFSAHFAIPAGVQVAADTLQLNGISSAGDVRSLSMGLVVADPQTAAVLASTGTVLSPAVIGLAFALIVAGGAALVAGATRRRRKTQG